MDNKMNTKSVETDYIDSVDAMPDELCERLLLPGSYVTMGGEAQDQTKIANFVFVVMDDCFIYVGKRVKPPHPGLYGPVGGKADPAQVDSLYKQPKLIELLNGEKRISLADHFCKLRGLEYTTTTATRELCEEVFSNKIYPADFSQDDITDVFPYCYVIDNTPEKGIYCCYFHIAKIHRKDIFLKQGEVSEFGRLVDVPADMLFPSAKLALEGLRVSLKRLTQMEGFPYSGDLAQNIISQIPKFSTPELTDLMGKMALSIEGFVRFELAYEALG